MRNPLGRSGIKVSEICLGTLKGCISGKRPVCCKAYAGLFLLQRLLSRSRVEKGKSADTFLAREVLRVATRAIFVTGAVQSPSTTG